MAIIGGGLGIFLRKMYRLMNQGSHTVSSWRMKSFVGTEKTSVKCVRYDNGGVRGLTHGLILPGSVPSFL